jgi:coenzyme F420-reducing hydrogenase delta subunit
VGVDWLAQDAARERIERWLAEAAPAGGGVRVALACAHSAGGGLHVDGATGACPELPGYRVLQVPCAGWIHTLTLERALRRGASDALVVSCPPGACHYREGERWIRERVEGERTPALRVEMVARERIHLLPLARTATGELVRMAGEIRRTGHARGPSRPGAALSGAASVALALGVAGALGVVSDLGYAAPRPEGSELVVTFKHPGHVSDECRELSPEEQAARPRHMRRERICARERAPVRLRVTLDGERVVERSYPPSGIWGDGSSIAVEPFAVAPGRHRVRVEIGDEADDDEWNHAMEQELEFGLEARRVVTFDKLVGFGVH